MGVGATAHQSVVVMLGLEGWGEQRELEIGQHWELIEKELTRRHMEVVCYLLQGRREEGVRGEVVRDEEGGRRE